MFVKRSGPLEVFLLLSVSVSNAFSPVVRTAFLSSGFWKRPQFQQPSLNRLQSVLMSTAVAEADALNDLPRWDLERHFPFPSPHDSKVDATIDEVEALAKSFNEQFKGKLEARLGDAVLAMEKIVEKWHLTSSYLSLSQATQLANEEMIRRASSAQARFAKISADFLNFFKIELAALGDEEFEKAMKADSRLERYRSFLEETRKSKPFLLEESVERALTVRGPWAGTRTVTEFFEQELSKAKFKVEGEEEELGLEQLLSRLSSPDQSVRQTALKSLNAGLELNKVDKIACLSLNMVCGSWHIENEERGYKNLRSKRNLNNNVPDEVVDALLETVRSYGPSLTKRYYQLKKKVLQRTAGLKEFTWADRNAPLEVKGGDKVYSWNEAVEICLRGYKKFSPRMATLFQNMVAEGRLDAPAADGKRSGAFCSGVIPGVGPFQLHNYQGTKRCIATLAHESGHGCHYILSGKQGALMHHAPLTLAETASIFGEMVVFRDLLDQTGSKTERLGMILLKIDDIVNSVVRQCSFDRFEELAHTARSTGRFSVANLDSFWKQTVVEYYGAEGEVFDKYEDIDKLWSYVPHFHSVPFYVYAYAFADMVVGSLYSVYAKNSEGFEEKLIDLLEAGGTRDFVEALKPFGLDPSRSEFWKEAFDAYLEPLLSEAEELAEEIEKNPEA
uniref:Peptidase M3A/M3B catalytic domain-containing protein n=1 Tax=Chromera velia CCMP2878 TaxID=1169474 RepID=A0A0G4GU87_9ALVE|mmetsp:Transcript_31855/g.63087  ORF Transcript_31855/g.63087 Transcript_31855/m.63087 type:complete len:674 (+) Transcript_31855:73-2094(+)|eukprot:Cvel_5216.t1-p1 / transcript=Cvel_5216.t1 / gene=Cvel_5216 / organism=Chromera_velia_CCMP2878 / gene_product=Oligoendopeptidase F homolog, putative / transcript_product=Oligoendopeptidase F homolog, putative / location=Cvel_scaffold240:42269-48578(+) / protein_length=673 / sequence_SO=supercontig / SO=protein_coding / is_pseudo=false